jgi:hypothetical protein
MAKSKSRGGRTGKRSRSKFGAGHAAVASRVGGSHGVSVDRTKATGGSYGLKAQRAGHRIGGK